MKTGAAGKRVKHLIAGVLRSNLAGRVIGAVLNDKIRYRGLKFSTASPCIKPRTKAGLFWGFYESAEIRFIEKYLSKDDDVIELGSSIGVVSGFIKRRIGPDRLLICVEPDPELARQITMNLEMNGLANNVTVLTKAIAYDRQATGFRPGGTNTGGALSNEVQSGDLLVETTTLSEIVSGFRLEAFTLVVDIEGQEWQLIQRERDVLKKCSHIFIELHEVRLQNRILTPEDMIAEVCQLGFSVSDRYGAVVYFSRNR